MTRRFILFLFLEKGFGSENTDNACERIEMLQTRMWGKTENHTPVRKIHNASLYASKLSLMLISIRNNSHGNGIIWSGRPV